MATNVLEQIPAEDQLRVGFLTAVRRRWSTEVFDQLRREYRAIVSVEGVPSDLESAGTIIERCPSYPWFGWLERGAQKLKWRTVTALVAEHWDDLSATFDHDGPSVALTGMQDDLPDWYTEWDIHCQPGGVWGDRSSALVYELGTKVLHIGRNSRNELHELFTRTVIAPALRSTPDALDGGHVVDIGCGFGKSTTPIKELLPQSEVVGIDLSAPCIELAAARASQSNLDITFHQADAAALPFRDASVDIAAGTMVLHEMPLPVLRAVLREITRVLVPGGAIRFLEFMRTGDDFRDAVMNDHAWRNNEPFMPGLMDLELEVELAAAGLTEARWVPFDERGIGPLPNGFSERDEWHFPWAVLEARRPE